MVGKSFLHGLFEVAQVDRNKAEEPKMKSFRKEEPKTFLVARTKMSGLLH